MQSIWVGFSVRQSVGTYHLINPQLRMYAIKKKTYHEWAHVKEPYPVMTSGVVVDEEDQDYEGDDNDFENESNNDFLSANKQLLSSDEENNNKDELIAETIEVVPVDKILVNAIKT